MMGRAMPWLAARFLRASSVSARVRRMPIGYRGPTIAAPHAHGRLVTPLHAPTHLREHHQRICPAAVSCVGISGIPRLLTLSSGNDNISLA
jgi:hypothetical protein